jgi:hypothetical protein
MAKPKFVWNLKGFEELRRNSAAVARVQEEVDRILGAIGPTQGDYKGDVSQAQGRGTLGRAIGHVWTADAKAMADNSRNHTLLRALGGGSLVVYTSKAGKTSLVTQKQADNYSGNRRG